MKNKQTFYEQFVIFLVMVVHKLKIKKCHHQMCSDSKGLSITLFTALSVPIGQKQQTIKKNH